MVAQKTLFVLVLVSLVLVGMAMRDKPAKKGKTIKMVKTAKAARMQLTRPPSFHATEPGYRRHTTSVYRDISVSACNKYCKGDEKRKQQCCEAQGYTTFILCHEGRMFCDRSSMDLVRRNQEIMKQYGFQNYSSEIRFY